MSQENNLSIQLRHWSEGDLPLLEKLMGDPEMTKHLGGPESAEQIARRHQRYLDPVAPDGGQMLVIVDGESQSVGSVGYWHKEWQGQTVYEVGWSVLQGFQGRGIAVTATALMLARMKSEAKYRFVHAFPSAANGASNGICKKLGFSLLGEVDFEYPKGHLMRCNDWQLDLLG